MKHLLEKIARTSILEKFENKNLINRDKLLKDYPFLNQKKATFVTLKIDNQLRGCIGSILPNRILLDDIIENSKSAAFRDVRFSPLTLEEFPKIDIEISILTIPKKIEYESIEELKKIIRPQIDGVILSLANYQATFLPVVWEELPFFELFFAELCIKAGMNGDCLKFHPLIYTYQVEKIK